MDAYIMFYIPYKPRRVKLVLDLILLFPSIRINGDLILLFPSIRINGGDASRMNATVTLFVELLLGAS
jgi:hypothetical protein